MNAASQGKPKSLWEELAVRHYCLYQLQCIHERNNLKTFFTDLFYKTHTHTYIYITFFKYLKYDVFMNTCEIYKEESQWRKTILYSVNLHLIGNWRRICGIS